MVEGERQKASSSKSHFLLVAAASSLRVSDPQIFFADPDPDPDPKPCFNLSSFSSSMVVEPIWNMLRNVSFNSSSFCYSIVVESISNMLAISGTDYHCPRV